MKAEKFRNIYSWLKIWLKSMFSKKYRANNDRNLMDSDLAKVLNVNEDEFVGLNCVKHDSMKDVISPHLFIWSWKKTMFFSILHKFATIVNWFSCVFIVLYLISGAYGFFGSNINPKYIQTGSYLNILIKFILCVAILGIPFSALFSILNGLKYYMCDIGFIEIDYVLMSKISTICLFLCIVCFVVLGAIILI